MSKNKGLPKISELEKVAQVVGEHLKAVDQLQVFQETPTAIDLDFGTLVNEWRHVIKQRPVFVRNKLKVTITEMGRKAVVHRGTSVFVALYKGARHRFHYPWVLQEIQKRLDPEHPLTKFYAEYK